MPRAALPPAMKDALLAATIGRLPAAGTVWPEHQRTAWFELMRKAVAMSYEMPQTADAQGAAAGQSAAASPAKYAIMPDGTATADGRMIDPHNIPPQTVVLDYRPAPAAGRWDDDLNPIMWLTQGAKVMRPPPGVKLRPTEGPMPSLANGSAEGAEVGA